MAVCTSSRFAFAAVLASAAGGVLAGPPALVSVGIGAASDITPDGMTAVGPIYDASLEAYIVYQFTRGAGGFRTDLVQDDGTTRCSSDASAMCWGAYDLENLAGFGTDRTTAHRWTLAGGGVNMGAAPTGNRCDFTVNSANDISGNGNRIVGGMWTDHLCGPYRAWSYDVPSGVWTTLPVSVSGPPIFAPASATRADSCSDDGNVICGYDQNYTPTFTSQVRRSAAWVWSGSAWVQTIFDLYGGAAYAVNGSGTACVGTLSSTTASSVGSSELNIQKWTRSGMTWTRTDIGRPIDRGLQSDGGDGPVIRTYPIAVSDDGQTIIGTCWYNDPGNGLNEAHVRPFIWKPSINEGQPMDLQDYINWQPGIGTTFDDMLFSGASALSADGNAILLGSWDFRHAECLATGTTGILYLNGTTCEAPGVVFSPVTRYESNFPDSGYFIFNVFASGSWPLTYQWQKETAPASDVWVDISDDSCGTFDPHYYDYRGTNGPQLRLGAATGVWPGRYRCVVTNSCGEAISKTARADVCGADFDASGFVDTEDYDAFVRTFELGHDDADFDGSGFVDTEDFDAFVRAFELGC